ncbi:MAG: trans-sulfuration enzyme family protein [Candidatus Aquicultorales bacterium]
MRFETKAIHVGQEADRATGATVPPLHLSSTFTHEELGKHKGFEYSRTGNPTRNAYEACLASLEGGEHCAAFASGSAASAAVISLLDPGSHVVAAEDMYGGTYRLFAKVFARYGIESTFVPGDESSIEKALTDATAMVWIESPTNPLLSLVDIARVARTARSRGALTVVDNTFASPYFQQPLALGADIVVHSTTKYIGGHSDLIGGAAVTSDKGLYSRLRFHQNAVGAVPSPFDCWLAQRGLKTLAVRMRQHHDNGLTVARMLENHRAVEKVYHPGLESHASHELALAQMKGFPGMVSFRLRGGLEAAKAFYASLRLFSLAESLGGVESLACHPATMTHATIPGDERERRGIGDGLVRLSVGIEAVEDLIEDLENALDIAAAL